MPAPLAVDREQVRMLVMELGVAKAAQSLNISLGTVKAWSARFGWIKSMRHPATASSDPPFKPQSATALQPLPASIQPVTVSAGATIATKPADALADTLADDSRQTRTSASRAVRRRVERLAESDEPADARNLHELVKSAAMVHGWDAQAGTLRISIYAQEQPEPLEKPAKVVEIEPG